MQTPDVNVLVNAYYKRAEEHQRYAEWINSLAEGLEPFALSELVLHGFIRVVTNRQIFPIPSTTKSAFEFVDILTNRPNCVLLRPGPQYWAIFRQLCEHHNLTGKLVADAAHAAVAIENGCEWVTADTDFARFAPLLRWRHL